jgi:hypothetical protein
MMHNKPAAKIADLILRSGCTQDAAVLEVGAGSCPRLHNTRTRTQRSKFTVYSKLLTCAD